MPGAGVLNDPFTFYYAIYLPNQQLQSMRPTPLDSVNDAMVARQYYAQQNRRGLYDPISPYSDTYDPLRPYSDQRERVARPTRFSRDPSNVNGMGPPSTTTASPSIIRTWPVAALAIAMRT